MTLTHASGEARPVADPKRWLALAIIAIAQLMVVLDASIVTIALPSAQRSLHISTGDRQWVVTAYTLAFGGLLLLGGRIADYAGRKLVFIIGLLGFAGASAMGGLAPDASLLFAARALQGAFAAIMAPAALSLLTVTFTEPRERARAFGVYGGISGGGAAIGLILGGLLTEFVSWRWCLLVNVPIALLAALAAGPVIRESRAEGNTRYDIPGTLTVTAGLVALVYGFTKASSDGWTSSTTITFLLVAIALLASFVVIERRVTHALLPLRVVLERNRGASYLAALLATSALFGMFVFLSYYFQGTLHYSSLKSGIAFLPFSAGIIFAAGAASQAMPRIGPRPMLAGGLLLAAGGLLWLTQLSVHAAFAAHVLPAELMISIGMGFVFVPLNSTALFGISNQDAGVASGLINAAQQVGGSLGTALLNTIAATATTTYITAHGKAASASGVVHGYTVAFGFGTLLLVLAALVSAVLVSAPRDKLIAGAGEVVPALG